MASIRLASEDNDSDNDMEERFSRLGCDDSGEAEFEKKRRAKHVKRRADSRVFKRSHSQSAKGDAEATDSDAIGDQDLEGSARRLRRRVRGPSGVTVTSEDSNRSAPEHGSLAPAAEIRERQRQAGSIGGDTRTDGEPMEVDDSD